MVEENNDALAKYYNKRFKNDAYDLTKISDDETHSINYLLAQIHKNKKYGKSEDKVITIFDFGCGDGRLHPLYESIAHDLSKSNVKLRIIAVDSSEEALIIYHSRCLKSGYLRLIKNKKDSEGLYEKTDEILNYPVKKANIEVFFKNTDINGLLELQQAEISIDAIISAAVLCHILGPENRLNMLKIFFNTAEYLFISQPTLGDFSTIQERFSDLRKRKSEIQIALEEQTVSKAEQDRMISELSEINVELKDALSDGEIYYKAGWVRGMEKKLPELKDHEVPYFGSSIEDAKSLVETAGYKYCSTSRGTFGHHGRWIISLASKYSLIDKNY